MRILVIGSNVPSSENPTSGIFEHNQALALCKAGHDVVYAAVDLRSLRRRRRLGIQLTKSGRLTSYVISIPLGRVPMRLLQKGMLIGLLILFRYIYKTSPLPEVIHSHFLLAGSASAKLSSIKDIPFVHTEHSSQLMQKPLKQSVRELAVETYSQAKKIISVSPALQKNILTELGIESIVIPNIINTSLFYNRRVQHEGFRVISVGNLLPNKQMGMTIEAFARSIGKYDSSQLTIVGEGPERKMLEDLADTLGVSNKIHFAGIRDQRYVSELFAKSDLFVLASRKETFGVVYVEALASGLPVIATRCGGPEHFLSKKNSIMVNTDDLNGLTDGIKRVYNGDFVVNAEESSFNAKMLASPNSVSTQLADIYKNILSEG